MPSINLRTKQIRNIEFKLYPYTCSGEGIHSILCEGTATLHRGEESQQEAFLKKIKIPDFMPFFFKKQVSWTLTFRQQFVNASLT